MMIKFRRYLVDDDDMVVRAIWALKLLYESKVITLYIQVGRPKFQIPWKLHMAVECS
eukprot:c25804_g1_i1 orf=1-168(-)